MELFVINRYTGEEANSNETPNEEDLKKKLLKKIKKRKKLIESVEVNTEENKKHRKRKNSETQDVGCINGHSSYFEAEEQTVESPRKKKKKESKEVNLENNKLENIFMEENEQITKFDEKVEISDNQKDAKEHFENEKDSSNQNDGETGGFTILDAAQMSKKEKVKRKLPNWLANPSVVSVDLKNLTHTIDSIPELDKIFVDQLRENNISHFFPVQCQIIPWLLKNAKKPSMYWANDICVSAPTGSGKTLAFVLPLLQILHKRVVPRIRALVVLPVQDLAAQVFNVFKKYSKPTKLNILLLCKKRPFKDEQALICEDDGSGHYKTLVDIIVTTPGRLVEHLTKTKGLCLNNLDYLVIDEADRVMEKVQNDWLYHLNKKINSDYTRSYQVPVISYNNMLNGKKPPNKLLFSATLSQDPEKLQQLGLFQPKLFTSIVKSKSKKKNGIIDESKFIGKFTTPAELKEYYTSCEKSDKPLIVHHLLKVNSWRNVLCFVNSAEATKRLSFVLKFLSQNTVKIGKLSASLAVRKRDTVLEAFSKGELDVLISSDALARGIDIPNVQYVISYDAPKFIKTYVHRIGRTGRAGKKGTSLVLLTSKEVNNFQKIIEVAGKTKVKELEISPDDLEPYNKEFKKALSSLGDVLKNQKRRQLLKDKKKQKLNLQAAKRKYARTRVKSLKKN